MTVFQGRVKNQAAGESSSKSQVFQPLFQAQFFTWFIETTTRSARDTT